MLRKKWLSINIALVFFILAVIVRAEPPVLWGNLEPGPYGIGFKTIEKYDISRTIRPKYDYFGELIDGQRARPIQACCWYPALKEAEARPITYAEYEYSYPGNIEFIEFLGAVQMKYVNVLLGLFQNNGIYMDFINTTMAAVKDAPPADGPYPLIAYMPNLQTSYADNLVLCEYLASHGFVVVSTHPVGRTQIAAPFNTANLETVIRDMEIAVSMARELPQVDPNKTACIGFGTGSYAALIYQMRNYESDALVMLEGNIRDSTIYDIVKSNPFFNAGAVSVPLLNIQSGNPVIPEFDIFSTLNYADRYTIQIDGSSPESFSLGTILRQYLAGHPESNFNLSDPVYEEVCQYTHHFFNWLLTGQDAGREMLISSDGHSIDTSHRLSFIHSDAEPLPPTAEQFVEIINSRGAAKAEEIYNKFCADDPGAISLNVGLMNQLGYGFLGGGRPEDAVIIFRLNAQAFPDVANCWDSYADGCRATGDLQMAETCYKKVLELLDTDESLDDNFRDILKNNAEEFLGIDSLENN
jgi:hypothetical protein